MKTCCCHRISLEETSRIGLAAASIRRETLGFAMAIRSNIARNNLPPAVIREATGGKYQGPGTSMTQVRSAPLSSPEKIPIFFALFFPTWSLLTSA
jgi:hypothetical protein